MSNKSMNIRMDPEVKEQAQKLFAELGMDMTTAINIFLRQAIRTHSIPFKVTTEVPNAKTIAAIEEGERLLNDPQARSFHSVDELFEELDSD